MAASRSSAPGSDPSLSYTKRKYFAVVCGNAMSYIFIRILPAMTWRFQPCNGFKIFSIITGLNNQPMSLVIITANMNMIERQVNGFGYLYCIQQLVSLLKLSFPSLTKERKEGLVPLLAVTDGINILITE